MAIDAEVIADRRRLRRKLSFWRVLAILIAIAGVIAAGLSTLDRPTALTAVASSQVARINVSGFIGDTRHMAQLFKRVGEARNVAGVVLSVNSPGGTTTGAEELYRSIRELAQKKPVVAFVDGTAASGGYIAAIAADHIVARETSIVGSVGVIFQYPDVSKLLESLGVQVQEVKSAPLKAEPSPFHPTTPEARAAIQAVVNDTYEWFKNLVVERRRLSPAEITDIASGRIYSGRQAVALRLTDGVGSERDAIAWLEKERGVARDLPVRKWEPRDDSEFDFWVQAATGADLLGFEGVARQLRRASSVAREASLDGLLALWHPAASEK